MALPVGPLVTRVVCGTKAFNILLYKSLTVTSIALFCPAGRAERIQSAQPEPEIYFTMSSKEMAQAILDYWTPERMATARPEEDICGMHSKDETATEMVQETDELSAAGPIEIVSDEKVKTFPYQSVGKLFYTKVGPSGSSDKTATAYVADLSSSPHAVLTAAHVLKFYNGKAENIIFIPGLIPPSTYPFGKYPQISGGEGTAWFVNPKWKPNQPDPAHDEGLIRLDKDPTTGKYVDAVVPCIQILLDQQYTPSTTWNSIGYPTECPESPEGKMCERSGNFNKKDSGAVYKDGPFLSGTSGGPWILAGSENKSNGLQSASDGVCAISPYFSSSSKEWFQ